MRQGAGAGPYRPGGGLTVFPQLEKDLAQAIGPTARSGRSQSRLATSAGKPGAQEEIRGGSTPYQVGRPRNTSRKPWSPLGTAGMSSRSGRNSGSFSRDCPRSVASGALIEPMAVVELNNKLRRVEAETRRRSNGSCGTQPGREAAGGILANQEIWPAWTWLLPKPVTAWPSGGPNRS